jgi:penicillin-binding protein 1A
MDHPPTDPPPGPQPDPGTRPADPSAAGASPPEPAGPAGAPAATAAGGWSARLGGFRRSRFWRIARWPLLAGVGLLLIGIIGFVVLWNSVELPDDPPVLESSVILDTHGEEIAVLQKDGLRAPVELSEVAPVVVEALVAAEDRRFYEHGGVDPVGIVRAFVSNLRGGSQGGSTITQQLVKNSYLDSDRSIGRKLREAVLSIKLEQEADKDEILERYLNTVYFGRGAYGIEAAATVYFETSAADLELHEAALLVGLLRAPETADPADHRNEARRRRQTVLDAMVETGDITRDEADEAADQGLGASPQPNPVTLTAGVAPHFVEWVRGELIERFGEETVYGGGLRITTTLDLDDQRAAESAMAAILDQPDDPQAAIVGLGREGEVRAYVGGRDFDELQVDLARGQAGGGSGRQPGSTFKPFVLAAALEQDIPLGTLYPAPSSIEIETPEGPYEVANYGGQEFGTVDLTDATADSVNTVYAQLAQDVGPEEVVRMAARAGITSPMEPNASLALGTAEVSPLELAGSYLTFARDGQRVAPWVLAKVEDSDGEVLFLAEPELDERAIPEGPARALNHALRAVVTEGTGTAAALDRPVAGKTGTTQGNGDAWFAGYTPEYAAVVWMGYPEGPDRPMDDVRGGPVTGGGLPAQMWRAFMEGALADVEPTDFAPPPEDLLRTPEPPVGELTVEPSTVEPGESITVTGTGFEDCVESWYVVLEPGGARSTPEEDSDQSDRATDLSVPEDTPPGPATITAWCDLGTGAAEAGVTGLEVLGPPEEPEDEEEPTEDPEEPTDPDEPEQPEPEQPEPETPTIPETPDTTLPVEDTTVTTTAPPGNNGNGNGNGRGNRDG